MRELSDTARHAIQAQETAQVFLAIVKIEHDLLPEPWLFASNMEDVVRDDGTYVAWPFEVTLPSGGSGTMAQMQISIDNVSAEISRTLKSLTTSPTVTVSIVLASSPNTVEVGPFESQLRNVEAPLSGGKVTGTLFFEDMLNEVFPCQSFIPGTHPGLFV